MKVFLVEPWGHLRGFGHPTMYPKLLGRALAEAGVDVTVVTFDGFLEKWDENTRKLKHVSFLSRGGVLSPLLRFFQNHCRVSIFSAFILFFDAFLTTFLAFLLAKNQRGSVIHVIDSFPSSLPLLLAFVMNIKNHGLVINFWIPSAKDGLILKFSAYWIKYGYERNRKRNRVQFVCETRQIGESFTRRIPEISGQLNCIPVGVEKTENLVKKSEARKYLNLPRFGTIFLTFGVTHAGKKFETIFKAVQNLPKNFIILHAGKIVGADKGNDPRWLAKKYGWMSNTIIVDQYIPEEEIVHYFSASDAILLSYRRDFLHAGGGLSHACQFLLPVIASDVGQLGEFVRTYELGLTFAPEDPNSLREAIITFLNLPEKEKLRMKENLQKFAYAYSWKEIAKKYLDVYRK